MDPYGDNADEIARGSYHRLTDEELRAELRRVQERNARISALGEVPEPYKRELRRLYELRNSRIRP